MSTADCLININVYPTRNWDTAFSLQNESKMEIENVRQSF